MSISISGSNAISGLSGMDTDFDVALEKLYSIEKTQLNQLEAWKSDWQLRYDAFNNVIDQMSAAKQMLSNIGGVNKFVSKNAVSTDEAVLTAVAAGSAVNGQHKITVEKLASNAIWCNTGQVFQEKSDIINKTGGTVDFTFNYAGKDYTYHIAANTTLESFVSMINNASDNPGITVSLLNTGNGYVYQVAGKKTGEENSLTIFSCGLEGMNANGSTSVWRTDSPIDINNTSVTDPTQYVYTATLDTGTSISVTISGDASNQDLATALNNAAGTGLVNASVDANGKLVLDGIASIDRKVKGEDAYQKGYKLVAGTDLNNPILGADSDQTVHVKVFLDASDAGKVREFDIKGNLSKKDFINQINQSLNTSSRMGMDDHGSFAVNFAGVDRIEVDESADWFSRLGFVSGTNYESGTKLTSTELTESNLTLTFESEKLTKRVDGKDSGDPTDLIYTIEMKDGSARYISLQSDSTNETLMNSIKSEMGISGEDTSFTLNDVKSIYLSKGSASAGFTQKLDAKTVMTHLDSAGNAIAQIENPPDLKYTIKLNSGFETEIVLPGDGTTSMQNVVEQIRNMLSGQDVDVSLVDANGNAWDSSSSSNPYLRITNALTVTGPGITGQVVESSNWSITQSSNAVYQVDNWPMAMESSTNEITDLLDGVALTLQGVGTSTLTVSTDIQSVETNIQNFLDAVNSVLMTIRDLTKVDDSKEVTSNDPDNIGKSNYSKSTLTSEKGGLLTGNYGVQLVKSRFISCVTGTPPGFQSMASADDLLSGDILSNLANMGIKTDTDATSQTYGLLVVAPSSDLLRNMDEENYEDMINNHINELVDFFVCSGKGTTTSADFRYNSHIDGITEAGTYDVSYTVDANGTITDVMI
ncbi:MAG: flagellar filament capping protein FliD, partial [Desulfovibrio sp.]|nr:flagellar filament capping protein FliD [Desulfovibrio sp.]